MQNPKQKTLALIGVIVAILILIIFFLGKSIFKNIPTGQIIKTNISEESKKEILSGSDKDLSSKKDLVEKYTKDSQTLTIEEKCKMDPLVIRFKSDSVLTIENKDSEMHAIAFENQNFFTVSPQDTREINIKETFKMEEGILHYRCSDISEDSNVGVMYITK